MSSLETRLRKELTEFNKSPPQFISIGVVGSNYNIMQGSLLGEPDSPYVGGLFFFNVNFPSDYPNQPPSVSFTTDVYHPIIKKDQQIPLLLWKSNHTVSDLLNTIYNLFQKPDLTSFPIEHHTEFAKMYRCNKSQFREYAKEWTKEHAI